ncbi:MAG: hypothetical protein HC908_11775 [Calothrix sp. SM1_7_51]|nr:hypothetical protein [Calothrix sp. SM1_7_51]
MMNYLYKILLILALVPLLYPRPCQEAKILGTLNWLPDVSEKQVQVATFLEILEPLSISLPLDEKKLKT